jgi:hypothetical protein
MRQDVANRDRGLPVGCEFGNVTGDWIIDREQPALPHLRDGEGGDGLDRRHPQHQVVGAHRHAGSRLADT